MYRLLSPLRRCSCCRCSCWPPLPPFWWASWGRAEVEKNSRAQQWEASSGSLLGTASELGSSRTASVCQWWEVCDQLTFGHGYRVKIAKGDTVQNDDTRMLTSWSSLNLFEGIRVGMITRVLLNPLAMLHWTLSISGEVSWVSRYSSCWTAVEPGLLWDVSCTRCRSFEPTHTSKYETWLHSANRFPFDLGTLGERVPPTYLFRATIKKRLQIL